MKLKFKIILIILITVCITLVVVIAIFLNNLYFNERDIILLEYGDSFPAEYINNHDKTPYKLNDKYCLYLYISKYCNTCLDDIYLLSRYIDIYENNNLNIYIVWRESIPNTLIKKHDIAEKNNLYINDNISFGSNIPRYYITNTDSKIIFISNDLSDISGKLLELNIVNNEDLLISATNHIIKEFDVQKSSDKIPLIYFTMEGCPDCIEADKILIDDEIKKKFDIIKIYSYHTKDNTKYVDNHKIFLNSFNINWYPSFLIINDDDINFIGKTSPDELKDEILSKIN